MVRDGVPVEREALYNEVWTEPVSVVAPRYGLSDVGLAKVCRALAIPLPSRGYWAKVKAGKVMARAPLPALQDADTLATGFVKLPPEMAEARDAARKAAAKVRQNVAVGMPTDGSMCVHPLVESAGRRLRRKSGWPPDTLLRCAAKEVIDIAVTADALERALSLVNLLINALDREGLAFEVDADKGETRVIWRDTGTKMRFSLRERVKRSRHEATPAEKRARERYWSSSRWQSAADWPNIQMYDYTPTGAFRLEIGRWPSGTWNDTERTRLEERLGEIVAGVTALAKETYAREQEQLRREQAHQLAVERFESMLKRRTEEEANFQQLESDATNWERASRLRAFIDAKESQACALGDIPEEQAQWFAWARAKADWLDPLIAVSDVVLDAPQPKNPNRW